MAKYSPAFWTANAAELFERMAYYAVFIVVTLYLSNTLGFSDIEASIISGLFSGGLYLLPLFTGALADKVGYRKSLLIAFTLLAAGYIMLCCGCCRWCLKVTGLCDMASKLCSPGCERAASVTSWYQQ